MKVYNPFNKAEREFCEGYAECALWASSAEDETPLDSEHDCRDIEEDSAQAMVSDCLDFIKHNAALLDYYCDAIGHGNDYAGHDFWLTRNHHGAGFWDRGAGAVGEKLTEAAQAYGESNLTGGPGPGPVELMM